MAAIPKDARCEEDISPLLRNETGAAYTEMLVCFMPMFTLITCLIQMALMNVAHLIVAHSAVLAARAAVVVLPDTATCYSDNPPNQLATGATGNENIVQTLIGGLGSATPVPTDFGGLDRLIPSGSRSGSGNDPQSVFFQTNARYGQIHSAASMPLMGLSPTPLMMRSRDSNIARSLGAGSATALLARMATSLIYNRAALAVTFLKDGQYANSFGDNDMVTVRVTYAFTCGVPLARNIMCKDALGMRYPSAAAIRDRVRDAIRTPSPGSIVGAIGAIRDAERDVSETDPGAAELRTAPNSAGLLLGLITGQRFAVIRAQAQLPNQGAPYTPRAYCGHRETESFQEECR